MGRPWRAEPPGSASWGGALTFVSLPDRGHHPDNLLHFLYIVHAEDVDAAGCGKRDGCGRPEDPPGSPPPGNPADKRLSRGAENDRPAQVAQVGEVTGQGEVA